MYYVYILKSKKDDGLYIGFTENLRQRFKEHNNKENQSTKSRTPFTLIFYESYVNKYDALRREKYFKSGKGRTSLNLMLKETLSK